MAERASKYDPISRILHAALATSVVLELLLQAFMRVPAGPGRGVDDWHRTAFELHSHFGPVVTITCVTFWIWVFLPLSRPGVSYLFPWLQREKRAALYHELVEVLQCRLPSPQKLSIFVGTVHGLGLLAVSGGVIFGSLSYVGYYTRVHVPDPLLHWSALGLIATSWLVWPFVIGHSVMAVVHLIYGNEIAKRTGGVPG